MISAVIPTLNDAPRLTATLAALAPAAVDGFVRQVIVADGGSSDETIEVAEDAGADVVTTGLADAIAAARQPWLLILAPGARPQIGWERAARAHMRDYPDRAGWFDLALAGPGIGARLREAAARLEGAALGRFLPIQGSLVKSQLVEKLAPIKDHQDVIRRLSKGQSRRLGVRVLVNSI
jgi:glycosyltransferase involved in cell wall biosynthesis